MSSNTEALKLHAQEKTKIAFEKADKAIRELSLKGERINFNSVANASGVSKAFLYSNNEVKERIELLRKQEVSKEINQRVKTDKTSKSKDIIIMAKDKKIRDLENENKKLKEQLIILRGKLYSNV